MTFALKTGSFKSPQCDLQSYSSFAFFGDVIPETISLDVLFRYYPAPSIIRLSDELPDTIGKPDLYARGQIVLTSF